MNRAERWQMYSKIQELKRLNLKISQIARHVGISRNTVYKYINMTPEEYQQELERRETTFVLTIAFGSTTVKIN